MFMEDGLMGLPSLYGFLLSSLIRVKMTIKCEHIIDKAKLYVWAILDSIPRTLLRSWSYIKTLVELMKNRILRNATIVINQIKFQCIDSESVFILSHDFESWMWSHFGLNQGDVFLDVGAHIGKYTIPISKIVGENGLVIAIEAHPENYKTLVKNIKLNGLKNIIALNVAAWNKECKLKLFNGEKNGQHSIKNDCGLGYVTVKAQALDNILDKLKVRRIDCIKIDVEKSELETLEGLVKTLKEHNPRVIVEILEDPIKVKDFMHKKGYVMQRIASHYYFLNPLRSLR